MKEILQRIPIWLIAFATVGLFGLLAYSVYDNRAVEIGPIKIGQTIQDIEKFESIYFRRAPDFDSDWIGVGVCQVKDMTDKLKEVGFAELPAHLTAYYKVTIKGEEFIIPWGVNQYGDGTQLNGILIDLSVRQNDGKLSLYIRSPCMRNDVNPEYTPRLLHLGWYKSRVDDNLDELLWIEKVKFRVLLWKNSASHTKG